MTSLYLHIPFCKKKCDYCSFYSLTEGDTDLYVDALVRAIKKHGGKKLYTVYIGGGTPSVLTPAQIFKITDAVHKYNDTSAVAEFTVECNPDSISADFIKASGADRVSMGFQSFVDSELCDIGRIHDSRAAFNAVNICRECGISNVSGDIIFALPRQDVKALCHSVKQLLALDVEHISAYNLQLEEGTPIMRLADTVADESTQAQMYYLICDMLKDAGYSHYEISNFAKWGKKAIHNSVYWQGGDYIGLGPSAHSKIGNTRYYFDADIKKFIDGTSEFDGCEYITDPLFEKIMLSLRTSDGIERSALKKSDAFIKQLENGGFAKTTDGRLSLTDKGFYLSNTIIAEITAKEC